MSTPLSAPLPGASPFASSGLRPKGQEDYPQKFEDIKPGSVVAISGEGIDGSFRATVLETFAEYGPTAIPAITVSAENGEPFMINASGRYKVQVVVDAATLAASATAPADAVKVQLIPVHGKALRFRGGGESATEIVRWLIGSRIAQYKQPTETEPDRLEFGGVNAAVCRPGDWIVKHDDGTVHVVENNQFNTIYEEAI